MCKPDISGKRQNFGVLANHFAQSVIFSVVMVWWKPHPNHTLVLDLFRITISSWVDFFSFLFYTLGGGGTGRRAWKERMKVLQVLILQPKVNNLC